MFFLTTKIFHLKLYLKLRTRNKIGRIARPVLGHTKAGKEARLYISRVHGLKPRRFRGQVGSRRYKVARALLGAAQNLISPGLLKLLPTGRHVVVGPANVAILELSILADVWVIKGTRETDPGHPLLKRPCQLAGVIARLQAPYGWAVLVLALTPRLVTAVIDRKSLTLSVDYLGAVLKVFLDPQILGARQVNDCVIIVNKIKVQNS